MKPCKNKAVRRVVLLTEWRWPQSERRDLESCSWFGLWSGLNCTSVPRAKPSQTDRSVTQLLAGLILSIVLKECIISYYLCLWRVKTDIFFFSECWMFLQIHYYISRMRTEWIKPEWALGSCCSATEDYWKQLVWFFFPPERLRPAQRSNLCRFWTICTLKSRSMFSSSQLTSLLPLLTIAPKHLHQHPEAH